MINIEEYGDNAIIDLGGTAMTFEIAEKPREFEYRIPEDSLQWEHNHYHIENFRIHPYGDGNDLPEQLRLVIQNHYMASGQLTKKTEMLWGDGPQLFREKFEDGKLVREWVRDEEVWSWINSFDGKDYLLKSAVDFHHIKGSFTKFILNRGSRIGKNKVSRLEHINPNDARLASLISEKSKKPTHIVVTDWTFRHINSLTGFKAYRIFEHNDPFANRNSIYYSNMYSFATDYYSVPDLYGSLEWIKRSSAIPLIFKALSKNSMNIKYHIQSPAEFWNQRREQMKESYREKNKEWKESYFREYKLGLLKKVAETLSGEENTGKFWHSEKVIYVDGHNLIEQGWEIKVIDQNIKDFIIGHISISDKADLVISAALGMQGSLAGNNQSRVNSGSEQLYAFKNFINSGVNVPETIICKPMNFALKANFPGKNLRIGFYHSLPEKESELSPKDRLINN